MNNIQNIRTILKKYCQRAECKSCVINIDNQLI